MSNLTDLLVSSQRTLSEFFSTFNARNVISSKFPIGVETIYKPDKKLFIKYEKNFNYMIEQTGNPYSPTLLIDGEWLADVGGKELEDYLNKKVWLNEWKSKSP